MRKFVLAASVALTAALALSACNKSEDADQAAAPQEAALAKPTNPTDTKAWSQFFGQIVRKNMQGMTAERPFPYFVPAGDDQNGQDGRARQLELVFEVRHGAQAAKNDPRTDLGDEMGEQAIETADFHVGQVGQRQAGQRDALAKAETGTLVPALCHGDHDAVEQGRGTGHQIGVTVGDRIERAGINGKSRIGRQRSHEGGSNESAG